MRSAEQYIAGILKRDRVLLARAITVIESDRETDRTLAEQILEGVLPHTGTAHRIGVTGIPGAGKSTLIDALGMYLIHDRNESVAVLTVDPSSPISGGSILGDKTRMEGLSREANAFIRPAPTRGHLGGVARRTRDATLLCEAAGFSTVIIETVGVGQSEAEVRSMADFVVLVLVAGAGDELQGIKKGILEAVDLVVINKADGGNVEAAERARREYESALHYAPSREGGWESRAITASARTGHGVAELWAAVLQHKATLSGQIAESRKKQLLAWTDELLREALDRMLTAHDGVRAARKALAGEVTSGAKSPFQAARQLLAIVLGDPDDPLRY